MNLRDLWKKIAIWFDPDRDWRSADKIMHAFGGFAVCLLSLWLGRSCGSCRSGSPPWRSR